MKNYTTPRTLALPNKVAELHPPSSDALATLQIPLRNIHCGNVDWEMSLRLLTLLVELNRMGKTILIATHDLNLIRQAKNQIPTRVLRIARRRIQLAGVDL